MSNTALLKIVAVLGHKGMNGTILFYTDLCICCGDTPCSTGSVHEVSLICACCTTTQFCSFSFAPLGFWCGFMGFVCLLLVGFLAGILLLLFVRFGWCFFFFFVI